MDPRLRDALVAVSAVNLMLLPRWAELLTAPELYVLSIPVPAASYVAMLFLVLATAAVGWGLSHVARVRKLPWLRSALGVVLLGCLAVGVHWLIDTARILAGHRSDWSAPTVAYVLVALTVIVCAVAAWRGRRVDHQVLRVGLVVALLLFPLAPVFAVQGAWQVIDAPTRLQAAEGEPVPWLPVDPDAPRIAVLLFDEMDAHLAFDHRPPEIELPHLDALRNTSVDVGQTYAPHSETMRSLPAMTTGRFVQKAEPSGWSELSLSFEDGDSSTWSDAPHMFDDARAAGQNVGIVGYFHPYCRLFSDVASSCTSRGFELPGAGLGLWSRLHLRDQLTDLLPGDAVRDRLLHVANDQDQMLDFHQAVGASAYQNLEEAAVDALTDPRLGLVFVHMNVPHPIGLPGDTRGFYDAETAKLATGRGPDYWDNLVLADATVGRFREAMEQKGLWNDTHVILTSDHGYRTSFWDAPEARAGPAHDLLTAPTEHRVPMLYKPAAPFEPMTIDLPTNNLMLREMSQGIRNGTLYDGATLAAWLELTPRQAAGGYHIY